MNELPWIVVHGRDVWVAALAGLPALGAVLGLVALLVGTWARARAARRVLGEPGGKGLREEGARVTVAGRWAGERVVSAFPAGQGRRRPLASTAEGETCLIADGETIAVTGTPAVLVGARETPARTLGQLPVEMKDWIVAETADATDLAWAARVELRIVEYGDRVYVGGTLRRVASAEGPGDYRRPAAAFAIAVEHGAEGQGIVCVAARPRAVRGVQASFVGALCGLGLFGLMFVGGGRLVNRLRYDEVAAATPFHREEVLRRMSDRLHQTRDPDPKRVDQAVAVARLHASPEAVEEALREAAAWLRQIAHHEPRLIEQEVALAHLRGRTTEEADTLIRHRELRRTADPEVLGPSPAASLGRARALVELGEWGAASAALEAALHDDGGASAAVVHLLAGRADLAARLLRRRAREPGPAPARGPPPSRVLDAVADALDARAGNAEAKESLRKLVAEYPDDRAPRLLLADLFDGAERVALLAHYTSLGSPARAAMSLERLLAREAGDRSGRNWERLLYPVWLAFGREEGHVWEFLPSLFEPEAALAAEPYARAEAAFAASALGDHARATALLPTSPTEGSLYASDRDHDLLSQVVERRGRAVDPMPGEHGVWLAHPISAWATSGKDGRSLARVLDQTPLDADHAYVVAGAVESGREELLVWLRHGAFEHRSKTRMGRLSDLENLRLFAVALGDAGMEEELGAIVARHRRALLRREILVPLAALEGLVLDGAVSGEL